MILSLTLLLPKLRLKKGEVFRSGRSKKFCFGPTMKRKEPTHLRSPFPLKILLSSRSLLGACINYPLTGSNRVEMAPQDLPNKPFVCQLTTSSLLKPKLRHNKRAISLVQTRIARNSPACSTYDHCGNSTHNL